jgi:hypothetical protein
MERGVAITTPVQETPGAVSTALPAFLDPGRFPSRETDP